MTCIHDHVVLAGSYLSTFSPEVACSSVRTFPYLKNKTVVALNSTRTQGTNLQVTQTVRASSLQAAVIHDDLCLEINESEVVNSEAAASEAATPELLAALHECAVSGNAPFFFPGHKQGAGAHPLLLSALGSQALGHDLPELPELDNLFAPEGVILAAQENAAKIFGAEHTFFLVNGSTVGIQAAVMSACPPGSTLVLPRNAHQCTFSAMALSGASPSYVLPDIYEEWGIPVSVSPAAIEEALARAADAGDRVGAVLVVSPTYHGLCSDVKFIAEICHLRGVPLIVDEAHGGHFHFHPDLPPSALAQGADYVVQSTHKVLGALTQSAMLHCQGQLAGPQRVARALQLLQSSSPNYLLLASLDAAAAHMAEGAGGRALLRRAVHLAAEARAQLRAIRGLAILPDGPGRDPLRITVGVARLGLSGYEADDILREEHGVVAELPSMACLTFALSAGTTPQHAEHLVRGLAALAQNRHAQVEAAAEVEAEAEVEVEADAEVEAEGQAVATTAGGGKGAPEVGEVLEGSSAVCRGSLHSKGWTDMPAAGPASMSPRDAFFAEAERVAAEAAVGRASAELLCPYPPGIPCVVPGETITSEAVAYLRQIMQAGGSVSGAGDSSLCTLAVIKH
eukprot:jgi/Mesen1/6936/ME000036S06268